MAKWCLLVSLWAIKVYAEKRNVRKKHRRKYIYVCIISLWRYTKSRGANVVFEWIRCYWKRKENKNK